MRKLANLVELLRAERKSWLFRAMQNDIEWVRELDASVREQERRAAAVAGDDAPAEDDEIAALDASNVPARFETTEFGVLEELLVMLIRTQVAPEEQHQLRDLRPRTAWDVLRAEQTAMARAYSAASVRRVTPEEYAALLADPALVAAQTVLDDGLDPDELSQ